MRWHHTPDPVDTLNKHRLLAPKPPAPYLGRLLLGHDGVSDGMGNVAKYLPFLLDTPFGNLPDTVFNRLCVPLHQSLCLIKGQHACCRAFASEQGRGSARCQTQTVPLV